MYKQSIIYPQSQHMVYAIRIVHLLFEAGVSLKEVQDRLGHTDVKTTMDIYTHVTQKQKKKQ